MRGQIQGAGRVSFPLPMTALPVATQHVSSVYRGRHQLAASLFLNKPKAISGGPRQDCRTVREARS
jgi:hypothetical protein